MAAGLRALPAMDPSRRRTNKQGAVRYLAKEIAAVQARGYTVEEIVESLHGLGLDITTPTLKSYLQRAKNHASKRFKGAASIGGRREGGSGGRRAEARAAAEVGTRVDARRSTRKPHCQHRKRRRTGVPDAGTGAAASW